MDINLSPLDIAGLVYLGLTLIVLYLVYRLLRKFIRYLWRLWSSNDMFGSDRKIKLLSLGIVALMFPTIFYAVGNAFIYLMRYFFADLPKDLVTNWQSIQTYCQNAQSNFSICASQLGYGFVQAWASTFSDSLNRFSPANIPYSKLILMLAVWAGISMLLGSTVSSNPQAGSHQVSRLHAWLQKRDVTARKKIVLALVLIVAAYLSIAAITAIPGLEESATPSDNVSEARLQSQLENAYKLTFDRIPAQIQFTEISPILPPTVSTSTDEQGLNVTTLAESTENEELIQNSREIWQSIYSNFLIEIKKQAESSKTTALSRYQASVVERKGSKETVRHFLDIDAWYQEELTNAEIRLSTCKRLIVELDKNLQNQPTTSQDISYLTYQAQRTQQVQQNMSEACQPLRFFEDVPIRQSLGSNLGPFSYVASWLLQTESLALAQIVGLLGFGLLGSAASSLVRNKQGRSVQPPSDELETSDELASVIIRGVTAAVVVFLSVKGGLAIFTSGDSSANSYVLLLTCLVAAVFSEDVWNRAQDWFNNNHQRDGNKPSGGTPFE